nr:hypothetical protein [Tanacetum cinerariifolium]
SGSNRVRLAPGPAGGPNRPLRNRGARQHPEPLPSYVARRFIALFARAGGAEPGQHGRAGRHYAARLDLQPSAAAAGWHAPERPADRPLRRVFAHRARRD